MAVKSILDLSLGGYRIAADEVELPNNSFSSSLRRRSAQMVPKGISEAIKRTTIWKIPRNHIPRDDKSQAICDEQHAVSHAKISNSQIPADSYFKGMAMKQADVGGTLDLSNQAASQRFRNMLFKIWKGGLVDGE